jgi:NodT family efflux transporter outer membrane factor (OMF) lipoprotein
MWTGVSLIALVLGGCAVGPSYKTPVLSLPAKWLGIGEQRELVDGTQAEQGLNMEWWQAFEDPMLNALMQQALLKNGDLKVAMARVEEARGARLSATANLLPEVDGSTQAARGNSTGTTGKVMNTSDALLNASWELDLFGGNRRAAEAARANLGSARAAERLARVRLLAEVANAYLDVRSLQQQALMTARNLDDQNETLRINRAQYNEGVASTLDVSRAEAQTADTAATLPLVQAQLRAAMTNLGVLTGYQPQEIIGLMQQPQPVPLATPKVLIDSPASVIARRPDVQVAERDLAAATANQGVALSNWFPTVNLLGLFGVQTVASSNHDAWSVGGNVTLPLIDFGRVRGLVRQANAQQKEALATYEQTVLAALADVETSMNAYVKAVERAKKLHIAAEANRKAVMLARAQYKEGIIAQLDVLVAQQSSAASDIAAAQGDAAMGQALAALYKAIGG